jgi:hypothetical protein
MFELIFLIFDQQNAGSTARLCLASCCGAQQGAYAVDEDV